MSILIKTMARLLISCSLVFSHVIWAACELDLGLVQVPTLEYDALEQRARTVPISMKPFNSGDSDCKGFLEIRSVDGQPLLSNTAGAKLNYKILAARDANRQLFDASTNTSTARTLMVGTDGSDTIESMLFISPNQAARSGDYTAELEAVFVLDRGGPALASTELELNVSVAPSVQANFVGVSRASGQGSASLLALGEMSPRMERSLGLQLRANSDVDVSIMSQNSGQLGLQNGSAEKSNGIDYHLSIGGNPVALETNGFSTLLGAINPNGRTIPITLQLSDFKNVRAGEYSDTIFVRISGR